MEPNKNPTVKVLEKSFLEELRSFGKRPIWAPEPDEQRFLSWVLCPPTFIIAFLWNQRILPPNINQFLACLALGIIAYTIKFWKRLKSRGEHKCVFTVLAAFILLPLLCLLWRWLDDYRYLHLR